MSNLAFELGVMARGIAGNADEADQHPEVKLLRSAAAVISIVDEFAFEHPDSSKFKRGLDRLQALLRSQSDAGARHG